MSGVAVDRDEELELARMAIAEHERILAYVTDRYSIDWSCEDTRPFDWLDYLLEIEDEATA